MRNIGTRGYSGYRGRKPDGKRWLVLLLALIFLAAGAFLFAQRYKVYHADGSFRYELPWPWRSASEADAGQELQIIVEDPAAAQSGV